MSRRWMLLSSAWVTLVSSAAFAEPTEQERVLANALFDEARALMSEGRFVEACPKFAESMRLQPGGGTLLNLGICHEREGKSATAWGELKAAVAMARRDGRSDREQLALERLAVVERSLSYITIRVAPDARVPGLVVALDGAVFGEPSWGSARPIDPGEHELTATAPGMERFVTRFRIDPSGHRASIDVPRLAPAAPAPAPERPSVLKGWHVGGIVAGGIGVIGLAFGTGFGLSAKSAWSDAEAGCPRPDRCSDEAAQAAIDAGHRADFATIGFVVGGVGIGLGAILFATGPSLVIEAEPGRAAASLGFTFR